MTEQRLIAGLAIAVSVYAVGAAQSRMAVLKQNAALYLVPDARREPLLTMEAGVVVRIERVEGAWTNVTVEGSRWGSRTGYVETKYLQSIVVANEQPSTGSGTAKDPPGPTPNPTPSPVPAAVVDRPVSRTDIPAPAPQFKSAGETAVAAAAPTARTRERTQLAPTVVGRRPSAFTTQQIDSNIRVGSRGKGRDQGLQLVDKAQRFFASLSSLGDGATASNGFTLSAYTPLAWVRQMASQAAKEYRPFTVEHVTDEMLEPVFRVVVYPDTPNTVTRAGMNGTSSVQHVVLRDENRSFAVQPLSKDVFVEEASNALGGRVSFEGLRVKFSMEDVRELRGQNQQREFFITVIGLTGEEKNFKVKKKHFEDLP